MAGTTHYSFEVMDPQDILWKVEIKDTTYAGTDTVDLTGTTSGNGFTVKWNGAGDELYTPVISSDFECQLNLSTDSLALFNAIIEGPECRFIVTISTGGTEYLRYFLLQDSMSKPDAGNGTDFITLTGTDGFGLLKDIEFTGYNINALTRHSYPAWMAIIGASLPLTYATGNVFAMASVWYEQSQESSVVPDPEAADPLGNTFMNESAFLQVDNYGVVKAQSLYDILVALLTEKNLQISQWNGYYLLIQQNTYAQASTRAWFYDSTGAYASTALITLSQAIPTRMDGGVFTYILPAKQVTTEYEYRQGIYANNLLPYNVDKNTSYSLGSSIQNADISFTGQIETVYNGSGGDLEQIQAVYKLLIQNGTKYLHMNTDGELEWNTSASSYVPVYSRRFRSDYAGDQVIVTAFDILTTLPEEDAAITFQWQFYRYEIFEERTPWSDGANTNTATHDDIEGTFIARINTGVAMEGTVLYKAYLSSTARADIELDSVGLGDGANKYSAGALFVNDTTPTVIPSEKWTIYSEIGGTGYPINSLRCREILALRRNTIEVYNGTLIGVPDIHKALTFDTFKYCITSITWNCFAGEYSFSAYKVVLDRTWLTIDNPLLSQETNNSGTGSGGSSGSTPTTVPYPLINNILEYIDNTYKPYAAKKESNPGYPYFYNDDFNSFPSFATTQLCLDSMLAVCYYFYVSNGSMSEFTSLAYQHLLIQNGLYQSFVSGLASNGVQIYSEKVNDKSTPVIIGSTRTDYNFNGQHIKIDDFLETFFISMAYTKAYGIVMSTNADEDQYSALNMGDVAQRKSSTINHYLTYNSASELTAGTNIFTRLLEFSKNSTAYGQFKEIINAAENWTTSTRAIEWIIQTVKAGATTLTQRLKIDKDGQFIVGDATNNTTFAADGTQRMNGTATVWDDLNIPGLAVTKAGANDPTLTAFGSTTQVYVFSGTTMNEVFFTVQLPHRYKEGSDIEPHVHWCPMTSPASTLGVVWKLDYQWQNYNGTFTATDTTIAATGATGTVGYKHLITSFGTISGSGKTISSVLGCRLYRLPSDNADTYTGGAGFLQFDFHFESDTLGSNTEYGK